MVAKRKICIACTVLLLCMLEAAGSALYAQDRPRAATRRTEQLHQLADSLQAAPGEALLDSLTAVEGFLQEEGVQAQGVETADSLQTGALPVMADSLRRSLNPVEVDSLLAAGKLAADSLLEADRLVADSIAAANGEKLLELASPEELAELPDSLQVTVPQDVWIPNPTKATWLALVIPGGGQIYNRKYWKLPIFYGGFAGCAYALTWNGNMYKDYANAYKDAVNGNWNSSSITDLLPANYTYSQTQLTETLRKRKDRFRRYRDLSIFAFIGVYLLSVVDAYVDAELSNFDITPDLSVSIEPTVIDAQKMTGASKNNMGLQCSFHF